MFAIKPFLSAFSLLDANLENNKSFLKVRSCIRL